MTCQREMSISKVAGTLPERSPTSCLLSLTTSLSSEHCPIVQVTNLRLRERKWLTPGSGQWEDSSQPFKGHAPPCNLVLLPWTQAEGPSLSHSSQTQRGENVSMPFSRSLTGVACKPTVTESQEPRWLMSYSSESP